MRFETTNKDEILYLQELITMDIIKLAEKIERRKKLLDDMRFAIELGDFN